MKIKAATKHNVCFFLVTFYPTVSFPMLVIDYPYLPQLAATTSLDQGLDTHIRPIICRLIFRARIVHPFHCSSTTVLLSPQSGHSG